MKLGKAAFWVLIFIASIGALAVISLVGKSIKDRAVGFGFFQALGMNIRHFFDLSAWIVTKG